MNTLRRRWRQIVTTLCAIAAITAVLFGASIARWEFIAWIGIALVWCWSTPIINRKRHG